MQTLAEQKAHYRAVRARIWGAALKPDAPAPRLPAWVPYNPVLPPPRVGPSPYEEWQVPYLPKQARIICLKVCQRTQTQFPRMASATRIDRYVKARQRAFYALRNCGAGYSLPTIGRWFGGRDHTTVLHGVRAHEARLAIMSGRTL